MKKINMWLFVPAIVYLAFYIYACFANGRITADAAFVINLVCMVASGVLMQKGIIWGSAVGIAMGAVWSVLDLFRTGLFVPRYVFCVPVIFYYICCYVYMKDTRP